MSVWADKAIPKVEYILRNIFFELITFNNVEARFEHNLWRKTTKVNYSQWIFPAKWLNNTCWATTLLFSWSPKYLVQFCILRSPPVPVDDGKPSVADDSFCWLHFLADAFTCPVLTQVTAHVVERENKMVALVKLCG